MKTGKISLTKRYILRFQPQPIIKLFNDIMQNKWSSINHIASNRKEAEGNIINKLKELRQLDLIEGSNESFKPTNLATKAYNKMKIPEYLNGIMKQNSIVREVISKVAVEKKMHLNAVKELIKKEMPFIDAKDTTWLFYARVISGWLKAVNILAYKDSVLLPKQTGDESIDYLNSTGFIPSIYMQQLGRFINVFVGSKEPKSIKQLSEALGRKSINGAITDSSFLGLVDIVARGYYKLTKDGERFCNMEIDERRKYIFSRIDSIEHIHNYINDIKSGIEQDSAFEKMVESLGGNKWSEETYKWKHKLIKNWLIYCGILKDSRGRKKMVRRFPNRTDLYNDRSTQMITIKNTPNLTGVSISGDLNDLYNLVEALHEITVNEYSEKHHQYINISTRVLGLCYDIRHAYQGDRKVELVDNNMTEDKMKWHSIIAPKNNVYYSCNYLYPEMFFVMLALNALVELRIRDLTKAKYIFKEAMDKKVIWDETIAIIRLFQAEFVKCVKGTFTEATFARWMNVMNSDYISIEDIAGQYVDLLNIKYIDMTKEKRLKNLSSIAKRIAEFRYDNDHKEIKEVVTEAAREHRCEPGAIKLQGIEYPEDFEW